jgi:NADH-quinone oxidoreductase subunit E
MKQQSSVPNTDKTGKLEDVDGERIVRIVEKHSRDKGGLIAILEEIQTEYGYLLEKALRIVSERTRHSLVDVYSAATFYRSFSLKPRGRHLICACLGTACHVRGAPRSVQEIEQQLGIKAGQTTSDREFTLETVNCLGACALGPVIVIDGHYFSKVKKTRVNHLLEEARMGFDRQGTGTDPGVFPLDVNCPHCNHSLKDETFPIDGHPSIRVLISLDHKQGWLRLSCLYGSDNSVSEFDVPTDSAVGFCCPHCGVEFPSTSDCPVCGAPMVPMLVDGGGIVQICSRRGCRHHALDLA